ncbi:uncharacterized protein LOC114771760 isoform X1 [Denticeps clupeoides]|uniref:uncharacterized protein LOC114771760 isoform X1 n=1 Tax=Denticeps clupeoides TaxID=299321 RepID=UPI0010A569C7|nr:uncharacterized protein LOC114771760 isoform X1 [Denticeps clupeoides]
MESRWTKPASVKMNDILAPPCVTHVIQHLGHRVESLSLCSVSTADCPPGQRLCNAGSVKHLLAIFFTECREQGFRGILTLCFPLVGLSDRNRRTLYGTSEEQEFRPHIRHMEPNLTECGLDWTSRLRWLPEPHYADAPLPQIKDIKFLEGTKLLRSFPQANMESQAEWTFHPNCGQLRVFHRRAQLPRTEQTLERALGRKKPVPNSHKSTAGGKPYVTAEYSPNFHKFWSLPLIPFGTSGNYKSDTFGPPRHPKTRQSSKKNLDREAELKEVERLNDWRPSPDLVQSVTSRHVKHA